jgi:hypothetical protein
MNSLNDCLKTNKESIKAAKALKTYFEDLKNMLIVSNFIPFLKKVKTLSKEADNQLKEINNKCAKILRVLKSNKIKEVSDEHIESFQKSFTNILALSKTIDKVSKKLNEEAMSLNHTKFINKVTKAMTISYLKTITSHLVGTKRKWSVGFRNTKGIIDYLDEVNEEMINTLAEIRMEKLSVA